VGEDQVPHVELTREIGRRFNNAYGEVFPEPRALLTHTPRLPGTDGRKMSKSYGNAIFLSDPPGVVSKKVAGMMTDPARKRRTDPGDPDVCPVFDHHKIFSTKDVIDRVNRECRTAEIGCVDCKKLIAEALNRKLAPIQERRRVYENDTEQVWQILEEGTARARQEAEKTMAEVRQAVGLVRPQESESKSQGSGAKATESAVRS
jgi:tryptophanyl-tRNA synthetase